ncbi:histidinol-phosphate aminotransferase [Patellaria atrata CBS 101060]|uniref:histidinol-phosphate transaminase n=1 Tax=Patellaria atrata CBS 101060 TaxID=1346257 RepID=A0A9P4SCN4_9PEZI|nr:histidinol-phosphate aminotransferase [Patellaria atrata CBS 101060]
MAQRRSPFNLSTCARPNILALEPYRCARDDYKDDGTNILLDANENAYGPGLNVDKLQGASSNGSVASKEDLEVDLLGLNRYPDPHQTELKQLLCDLRNTDSNTSTPLTPANLFVGVGSDEAIDNLLRAFCRPNHDKILVCPPTYGMYTVSAQINDIALVKVPLLPPTFSLDLPALTLALADPTIKLLYLCSPGNPTGTTLPPSAIETLLSHPTWNGVLVLDEAYIDFAPDGASAAPLVTEHPNLVVLQTLSKAFGLAGIRLGAAFTSPQIATLLNALKAPYNVSTPTSQLARAALRPAHLETMRANRARILAQRDRLVAALPQIPGVGGFLGGFDANFVLVQILSAPGGTPCNETALRVYERLAEGRGVVVRFRGREWGCGGCLRVTVGTEREVDRFLGELGGVLGEVYGERGREGDEGKAGSGSKGDAGDEERREEAASKVVG